MTEIVYGLDGPERDRIEALRKAGRFVWIDVPLGETSLDDLRETLGIPESVLQALSGASLPKPSRGRWRRHG